MTLTVAFGSCAVAETPKKNNESAIAEKIFLAAFFIRSSLNFGFFRSFGAWSMSWPYPGLAREALFLRRFAALDHRAQISVITIFFERLAASVQAPLLPGIGHEKDYEQKQQWQMVEFGAEVAPHRNSLSGLPPGGEREAQHVQRAQTDAGRTQIPSSRHTPMNSSTTPTRYPKNTACGSTRLARIGW